MWTLIAFMAPVLLGAQEPIEQAETQPPTTPMSFGSSPSTPGKAQGKAKDKAPPLAYSVELDADFGYAGYSSVQYKRADTGKLATRYVDGMAIGGHGEFGLYFLKCMMNYQYLPIQKSAFVDAGFGVDLILPYASFLGHFRTFGGALFYSVPPEALHAQAESHVENLGLVMRLGVGVAWLFARWFKVGVAVDLGVHSNPGSLGVNVTTTTFIGFRQERFPADPMRR